MKSISTLSQRIDLRMIYKIIIATALSVCLIHGLESGGGARRELVVYEVYQSGKPISEMLRISGMVEGIIMELDKAVESGEVLAGGPGVMVSPPPVSYKIVIMVNGELSREMLFSLDGSGVETKKGFVVVCKEAAAFLRILISGHSHSLRK